MTIQHFTFESIALMLMGWMTHWLFFVRQAKAASTAADTTKPSFLDYWTKDPESFWISVIGMPVLYLTMPQMAESYPELAHFIGANASQPFNPMASFLGGYFAPSIADWAGKRISRMVGD